MQAPAPEWPTTQKLEFLGTTYQSLVSSPPETPDFYLRLLILDHDLSEVLNRESADLSPDWQQYLNDLLHAVRASASTTEAHLNNKQMARIDFLYRGVLSKRENDAIIENNEQKQELWLTRLNRLQVLIVATLMLGIIVIALIGARALYLADSNFFEAVRNGSPFSLQSRFMLGKSVESTDARGRRALHFAAERGSIPIINLILAEGADLLARDEEGHLPIHYAAKQGKRDAVIRLLQAGSPVDVRGTSGLTPLMILMRQNPTLTQTLETADVLLNAGADINAHNDQESVLTLAILQAADSYRNQAPALAQWLIERGADPEFMSENGTTALGNALLVYMPNRPDPYQVAPDDPLVSLLLEAGAYEAYAQAIIQGRL